MAKTAAPVDTTPVIVDNTDPATLAQNNMGGPSVPGDMPAEIAALFAGTDFDINAPITRATAVRVTARKGRTARPLPERETKLVADVLKSVTGDDYASPNANTSFIIYPLHEDYTWMKNAIENWVKVNNASGIEIKVEAAKHAQSPIGFDPAKGKENKGKHVIYMITLSREEIKPEATEAVTPAE